MRKFVSNYNQRTIGTMKIEKISDLYSVLKSYAHKKRLAVANANDSHSIESVSMAVKSGLIEGILIGDTEVIKKVCKENGYDETCFRLVHEPNENRAIEYAVEMVRNGEADIIMKGLVSTDKYMRAILNKERGLAAPNTILSHITVMECPAYHKLLIISDVAVIPYPDLNQKISMIKYAGITAKALGIEKPKVALIAPTEQVLPKIQSTTDAAVLSKMGERGQIADVIIDGPMALDVAISRESAQIKKIKSAVAGDADCLIFPNLESGNVFYKTNSIFGGSRQGSILVGAKVPGVLSSRGDNAETKFNSIALAAILSER